MWIECPQSTHYNDEADHDSNGVGGRACISCSLLYDQYGMNIGDDVVRQHCNSKNTGAWEI